MRGLLTFVGFHDPFSEGVVEGQRNAGPVLSAFGFARFDRAILFSTPRTHEQTRATAEALSERYPETQVVIVDVPLDDPTDYAEILGQLRRQFSRIDKAHSHRRGDRGRTRCRGGSKDDKMKKFTTKSTKGTKKAGRRGVEPHSRSD